MFVSSSDDSATDDETLFSLLWVLLLSHAPAQDVHEAIGSMTERNAKIFALFII